MRCKVCKGTGKQTIEVCGAETGKFEMDCFWCEGTGEMTPRQKRTWDFARNSWCRCGNPSGESKFYDDGKHPTTKTHHYRCVDCGKITQIG